MEASLITGIALQSQQWVGYWGWGNPQTLPQSLTTQGDEWTISASGLTNIEQDAWVRQEGKKLVLGRSRFGRVPLYWMQQGQLIWFATRLQLLLPLADNQLNLSALYGYSCFSYIPTPLTPIAAIKAIPAGVELIWSLEGEQLSAPQSCPLTDDWQQPAEVLTDEETAISQLQTHLKTAAQRQISDLNSEPVGVFLSGGLDSSIVAALLVQLGVNVRAYSLDFGEYGNSELPYAEQVAQWLKIPLVKVSATPKEIKRALIPTVKALDMPFGDGVTVPLYLLNRAASQETKVIFNGEGGDQLFAGWTNKPLIAASIYQNEHPEGQLSFEQQYLKTFHRLWGYEERVFQPAVLAAIESILPQDWLYPALEESAAQSLLHRLRRATLMLKGAQNIQPRATNLAFANGLSVRSIFCDSDLTAWSFQLSGELCLQGACEKYILKRAVESWLPVEIVWRQKRGMGVPLTAWCLKDFWLDLGTWLNPNLLAQQGHWQPDIPLRVALGDLSGFIQGRRIGETLWLLIMWQLWRSYVLGDTASASLQHPFWLPHSFWRFRKRWT